MGKSYHQYCPIAHALDLVGERWTLLVVRELMHGPLRYSDLHERLPGCGTNILAARLKQLEAGGVVHRHRLPPPAASTVYELTEYGFSLRRVVQELARWGIRSLGPPPPGAELQPGWLIGALETISELPAEFPDLCVEFRVDGEVGSISGRSAAAGPAAGPDAIVASDTGGFFHLFVDGDLDRVEIDGDPEAVRQIVAAAALGPALQLSI